MTPRISRVAIVAVLMSSGAAVAQTTAPAKPATAPTATTSTTATSATPAKPTATPATDATANAKPDAQTIAAGKRMADWMRPRFTKADTDHDGFLTRTEAAAMPMVAKNFDVIDTRHTGKVSIDDISMFMAKRTKNFGPPNAENMQKIRPAKNKQTSASDDATPAPNSTTTTTTPPAGH